MKIVVENIFMCFVLFWKCYFPTNFSHFFNYFLNIQTNFITETFKITAKSQSMEQITVRSQPHTPPKLQFNLRQQTPAIKSHNHQNTTTTPPQQQQKSKSQKEIGGLKIGGSKALGRRQDRAEARSKARLSDAVLWSMRPVQSGACNRQTGAQGSPATSKAWSRLPLLPLSLSLSLSLSLFARLTWKWFELKIFTSNHFRGQSLILHSQLQITFGKFIFHAQLNTHIYEKTFLEVIWNQNKHSLNSNSWIFLQSFFFFPCVSTFHTVLIDITSTLFILVWY